jgi:hypothetical protein
VPSTDTRLVTEAAQAGLIAGTVPTKGSEKFVRRNQFAEELDDASNQFGLGQRAIGKRRVVGDVEKIRVRPRRHDLAIDGKAAEPGIEDENCLSWRHARQMYEN